MLMHIGLLGNVHLLSEGGGWVEIWGSAKIIGGMKGVYEKNCTSSGGSIKIKLMEPQGGLQKRCNTVDSQQSQYFFFSSLRSAFDEPILSILACLQMINPEKCA